MYGSDVYGSVPYGASGFGLDDIFDVEAMLSESRADLVVTLEIRAWNFDADHEEILRYGSTEWATSPLDIPASTPFEDRLTSYTFSRSAAGGDRFGGMAAGSGTIVLSNTDGALDAVPDDYGLAGRKFTVRVGRKTDVFADHLVIGAGVIANAHSDADTLTIELVDEGGLLNGPTQPNLYGGTGGADGGSDLTGKRKPRVYGTAYGVQPALINVASLIYQVSDRPMSSVLHVYDRGVQLTFGSDHADYAALASASVSAGTYHTARAEGLIRLGAASDGVLFCRASDNEESTSIDIVYDLVTTSSGIVEQDIDGASFDVIDELGAILRIGYLVDPGEAETVGEAVSRLTLATGCFAWFNRQGKFSVGRILAPSGDPVAYFDRDEGDIVDLNREKLPSGVWPPPWRWRVSHNVNYTPFTDFAGSVSDSVRTFFAEPYRLREAADAGVLTDYPSAQDVPPIEAHYIDGSLAADEAARLLALYDGSRKLYRIVLGRRALQLRLGDEINVRHPRFGLASGKDLVIVAIEDKIQLDGSGAGVEVEVLAFG